MYHFQMMEFENISFYYVFTASILKIMDYDLMGKIIDKYCSIIALKTDFHTAESLSSAFLGHDVMTSTCV